MTRRQRDLKRRLLVLAEPFGATVSLSQTGNKHLRATFQRGPQRAFLVFSATPSDWRGARNETADIRRKLRGLVTA